MALGYLALVSAPWGYTPAACGHRTKIAAAVSAVPPTAIGEHASAATCCCGETPDAPEVRAFLLEHHPDLWQPLLDLFSSLGAHIK